MARKIETEMLNAIRYQQEWRKDNTEVRIVEEGVMFTPSYNKTIEIYLHCNRIARIEPGLNRITVSSCGWRTSATKSRLNAILQYFNKPGIFQKNYTWHIGNETFADGMTV